MSEYRVNVHVIIDADSEEDAKTEVDNIIFEREVTGEWYIDSAEPVGTQANLNTADPNSSIGGET